MRRPGFLAGTDYWFGELPPANAPATPWRRSSSRPADTYYAPQTKVDWYNQFWVEEPVEESYLKD
jgi:hypothetical protein